MTEILNTTVDRIKRITAAKIAEACELSAAAVNKWKNIGHLPHSDMTGETDYTAKIIKLAENSVAPVTRAQLFQDQLHLIKPGVVYNIPVALIGADPNQPRKSIDYNKINRLGENIKEEGQESPVSFRINDQDDGPVLILTHGERRWRAIQTIEGAETIRGILDDKEDGPAARILRQVSDNEMRENLTAWDWACTFKTLHEDHALSASEIANQLAGRSISMFSRTTISNYLRMFKLDQRLQDLVKNEWLPPAHTKYILGIKSDLVLTDITEQMVKVADQGGGCPTVDQLQQKILYRYCEHHHGIGNYGKGSYQDVYNVFDTKTECDKCPHKIAITINGNNSFFCGMESCWDAKQEAYQNQDDDDEDDDNADLEETPEERRERLESDAKRKHRETYNNQIKQAVIKDPDAQLAMIYLLETKHGHIPHPDDFSGDVDDTRAILARCKQDRDAMLNLLVDQCLDKLYDEDIDALAYMIETEPYQEPGDDEVSQETDERLDLFKEAANV